MSSKSSESSESSMSLSESSMSSEAGPTILLVLDIDGTLAGESKSDTLRPGLSKFFQQVQELPIEFTLALWTAAGQERLDWFLEHVPFAKSKFLFMWTGRRCSRRADHERCVDRYQPSALKKPLEKIWKQQKFRALGFTRRSILILDNTPSTFSPNYGNGIAIPTFYGYETEADDNALSQVIQYLQKVCHVYSRIQNVREIQTQLKSERRSLLK